MNRIAFFLFLALPFSIFAQSSFFLKSEKQIAEARKQATVRIRFIHKGATIDGAGFFINQSGLVIVNSHILKLANYSHFEPEKYDDYILHLFAENDQLMLEGAKFLKCFKQEEIDLCAIKVSGYKNKNYIPLTSRPKDLERMKLKKVSVVGHCGKKFNTKQGHIIRYYEDFQSSKDKEIVKNVGKNLISVDFSPQLCGGDSGGPVFDSLTGKLYGFVLGFEEIVREDNKKYYLALPAYEIKKAIDGIL